ncbi:YceD family protein [Bifidobacterium phasiani]|uniref:DUF177 domain-containing protein n=1 Tax=Bifidobacterium phasiani TaxID=2834431 RepID=A0ABS6W8U4_9BIFI|nr:DUF177 domain-containing protein [Bifidobacterium phasiani]MBW3082762.1 DUF177 domain-containing protein [Bifidobacterium phasiani]
MPRPEDSAWAVSVAQVAARAGRSKPIDMVVPAPSGIGDDIVGIREGSDVHVTGSFDSIVDGLIFNGRADASIVGECTRCLRPLDPHWSVRLMAFFPYDMPEDAHGNGEEVDIIAGEDESEDVYPLSHDGAFADLESLLRDALVESLPLQPLCREDCRGLCSQCGADLNEDPDHHHDVTDIRFAALEQLKAQLEREERG